jgi:two-component system, OmpR family, response regulator
MSQGSVLVIDDDEWVATLLVTAIREAGYDALVCATAQAGLETACAIQPDCIICDIALPDNDGYWVARNVRTHPSRVSVTPFLFLSGLDDEASRLQGFHVGADVYMTKPFRVDEVVAQIGALVAMADRLRRRRDSMISITPAADSAVEGDLSQMSIATVLTVFEMEQRTGIFEVMSKKRRASLDIVRGHVIHGTVGGTKISALGAMRAILTWNVGRFSFRPTAARELPPSQKSLGALLIEALRLEDEAARAELELPPSKQRPSEEHKIPPPPALGGPASSPADLAPPSSHTPEFVRSSDTSLALDPEIEEWEIPSSISNIPPAPAGPLPRPPPLHIPRPAGLPPPSPGAQKHGARPLPIPPAPPRLNLPQWPPRPDPSKKR